MASVLWDHHQHLDYTTSCASADLQQSQLHNHTSQRHSETILCPRIPFQTLQLLEYIHQNLQLWLLMLKTPLSRLMKGTKVSPVLLFSFVVINLALIKGGCCYILVIELTGYWFRFLLSAGIGTFPLCSSLKAPLHWSIALRFFKICKLYIIMISCIIKFILFCLILSLFIPHAVDTFQECVGITCNEMSWDDCVVLS